KRKRSSRVASLIVAATGLLWNAVHLAAITIAAFGLTGPHSLVWLAALTRKDPYLVLALAPIPLGLLLAYRFHKATFMDLVLKKGGALLLILVLSVINARIWGGLYVAGSYHLNSTLRPIVFTGVWLTVFALYFPLRRLFYRAVDRYLLKRRDYSQVTGSLNERLRSATDEESIKQLIRDAIKEIFAADSAVFLGPQDDLAQLAAADLDSQGRDALLTRQVLSDDLYRRLEERRVEVVLRLQSAEGLMGVMLVGSRAYGQGYLSEELHALTAIAGQVAPVIENTRLHEVRRRQAIAEQELRKLATQAELKALRAQIDPHFFFNALNSVAALIADDPESAERLIEDISELFRHAFRPNREFVTLEQELELVDTYLQVESARLGERFKFEKLVDADTLELRIPALSIQPLVENAVKHGISKSSGAGRLVLSVTVLEDRLVVCVSDSGIGISPSELEAKMSRGVGLRNVDGRLAALYGETARLRVESECGRGTTVSFSIPLERCKVEPQ
ncbi:MAG: histidine kinase, partial [Blastocatellia bacterium]